MNNEIKIYDMRGDSYAANYINVIKLQPYYCGSPMQDLIKDNSGKSEYYYNIIQYGANVATIALTDTDYKTVYDLLNPIDFTRINSDVNGNPRFVCHFLAFINRNEDAKLSLDQKYTLALKRAKQLGGRKFHNKQYGGGIVFQMYDGENRQMSEKIRTIANNIN